MSRNSHWSSIKKAILKNFAILTGKNLSWNNFIVPIQVFSCEYCRIFMKTYFEEHLRTAASGYRLQKQ